VTLHAAVAVVCAAALAVAVGACGSSSPSDPTGGGARAEAALHFSKCMREHGVADFPNPEVSGNTVRFSPHSFSSFRFNSQSFRTARKACAHYIQAVLPHLTPQQRIERQEQIQKFARCMREHGVDLETSSSHGGISIRNRLGARLNPENPAFRRAAEACSHLLPKRRGGGFLG